MRSGDLIDQIEVALNVPGKASSDFDLNPDFELPPNRRLRDAGVLVPLVKQNDRVCVVLTKRSSSLKHHPGQIAFPGGKVDDSDTDSEATALREAHEEIGLPPDNVTVLGRLAAHETVTSFRITPVVGVIHTPFVHTPEPGEVAEVFSVPLDHVIKAYNFQIQSRRWRGQVRRYYTVPFGPYYIWGATARILRALAERLER